MPLALPSRRGFLFGAGGLLAAPAIVRVAANLMPISARAVSIPVALAPPYLPLTGGTFIGDGEPNFHAAVGSLYIRNDGPSVVYVNIGRMDATAAWMAIAPSRDPDNFHPMLKREAAADMPPQA